MKKIDKDVNIQNRKARHDYVFLATYTAGMVLQGSEVKSIRAAHVSLVDAYCYFQNGELFLKGAEFWPIDENYVHDPKRDRKLLLKGAELKKLEKSQTEGTSIIVSKIFTIKGRIKAEIVLAKGKKAYDKRQTIKDRDMQREQNRNLI